MPRTSKQISKKRIRNKSRKYISNKKPDMKKIKKEREKRAHNMLRRYGDRTYNMCATKRAYDSKSEAEYYAFIHTTPLTILRAYKCPYCKMWHITHKDIDDKSPINKSKYIDI